MVSPGFCHCDKRPWEKQFQGGESYFRSHIEIKVAVPHVRRVKAREAGSRYLCCATAKKPETMNVYAQVMSPFNPVPRSWPRKRNCHGEQ